MSADRVSAIRSRVDQLTVDCWGREVQANAFSELVGYVRELADFITEAGAGTPDARTTVALVRDGGEDPKGETRTR